MPRYPVLQPNGKFAVWSTIVDHFIMLDCSKDEAIRFVEKCGNYSNLPKFIDEVEQGKLPLHWWHDWPDLVADALGRHGEEDETVKEALALTADPMMMLRYIEMRVAAGKAEVRADDMHYELQAAKKRIAELEQALAQYQRAPEETNG